MSVASEFAGFNIESFETFGKVADRLLDQWFYRSNIYNFEGIEVELSSLRCLASLLRLIKSSVGENIHGEDNEMNSICTR